MMKVATLQDINDTIHYNYSTTLHSVVSSRLQGSTKDAKEKAITWALPFVTG